MLLKGKFIIAKKKRYFLIKVDRDACLYCFGKPYFCKSKKASN